MNVSRTAAAAYIPTSRAARRAAAGTRARAIAHEIRTNPGHRHAIVIGHVQRALYMASWGFTAREFLAGLGVGDGFVARFESAFGRAVAKAYRKTHRAEPDRGGRVVLRGRMWRVMRYADVADLEAGARAYPRTAHLMHDITEETSMNDTTAAQPETRISINAEDVRVGDFITVLVLSDHPYEAVRTVAGIERKPRPEFMGGGEHINLRMSDGSTTHLHTGRQVKVWRAPVIDSPKEVVTDAGQPKSGIRVGDRVSLFVSDCPDRVSGIVIAVYVDVVGVEVADVEFGWKLSDGGTTFTQNTEFLHKR